MADSLQRPASPACDDQISLEFIQKLVAFSENKRQPEKPPDASMGWLTNPLKARLDELPEQANSGDIYARSAGGPLN